MLVVALPISKEKSQIKVLLVGLRDISTYFTVRQQSGNMYEVV
jgi:hypothetical protein